MNILFRKIYSLLHINLSIMKSETVNIDKIIVICLYFCINNELCEVECFSAELVENIH